MPPWECPDADAVIMPIDENLGSGNEEHGLPHMALQFFLPDMFDDESSGSGERRISSHKLQLDLRLDAS